jgi:hypothetical protein
MVAYQLIEKPSLLDYSRNGSFAVGEKEPYELTFIIKVYLPKDLQKG